jgi:hypothetical protein
VNYFNNYKDKLESELSNSNFINAGDVISSKISRCNLICSDKTPSIPLLKKTICDIYDWSFERMIQKSEKIVFKNSDSFDFLSILDNIYHRQLTTQSNYNFPGTIFFSTNSFRFINQNTPSSLIVHSNTSINFSGNCNDITPDFFQKKFELTFRGNEISFFRSPLIKDTTNDFVFYLCDKPIQSMMWILQNMSYQINQNPNGFLHQIDYPIYECDYKSLEIRITDTVKIREEKINKILS